MDTIITGRGVLARAGEWMAEKGITRVLVVCDIHTEPYARKLQDILTNGMAKRYAGDNALSRGSITECSPAVNIWVYPNPSLMPDEAAVGKLLLASGQGAGYTALFAVGSGTLNDLTRYVAHRIGLPYFIAATAASMDGYTSTVAPLIVGGMKQTFPAAAPSGVIGDTDLLETAPPEMTAAGYGDIVGKWTSVNDWEVEHIVTGASFSEGLAAEMRGIVSACGESPEAVMDALLRSGEVMRRAGNSKPASGSEHHLSHFWEMAALLRGETPALHGAKVGFATPLVLRMAEWFCQETPDWARAYRDADAFSPGAFREEMRRVYGRAAEGVTAVWENETAAARRQDLDAVRLHWGQILEAIRRNLPPCQTVEAGLARMGCPLTPADIHVGRADFVDAVQYAFRLRPRFTLLRAADLLGRLPEYAERLAGMYF